MSLPIAWIHELRLAGAVPHSGTSSHRHGFQPLFYNSRERCYYSSGSWRSPREIVKFVQLPVQDGVYSVVESSGPELVWPEPLNGCPLLSVPIASGVA